MARQHTHKRPKRLEPWADSKRVEIMLPEDVKTAVSERAKAEGIAPGRWIAQLVARAVGRKRI